MLNRKFLCGLLASIAVIGLLNMNPVAAADANSLDGGTVTTVILRATGSFSMKIPANGRSSADKTFPMEAGETVTIKASYSPFSASVDFGLLDSDGVFHYINVTGGSIDETIRISERGNYTLAVRNNSSEEISVSGYVSY